MGDDEHGVRFLDSDVLIDTITAHAERGPTAARILKRLEEGELVLTSTLVLLEVGWFLEAVGKGSDVKRVLEAILSFRNLEVVEPTSKDLVRASELARNYELSLSQGVKAALMLSKGVNEAYSRDRGLGRVDLISTVFS